MKQFYDKFIKPQIIDTNEEYKLELVSAFTYNYKVIQFSHKMKIDDESVVNMLIYGKSMIRSINDVERLLSYVRFKKKQQRHVMNIIS